MPVQWLNCIRNPFKTSAVQRVRAEDLARNRSRLDLHLDCIVRRLLGLNIPCELSCVIELTTAINHNG